MAVHGYGYAFFHGEVTESAFDAGFGAERDALSDLTGGHLLDNHGVNFLCVDAGDR